MQKCAIWKQNMLFIKTKEGYKTNVVLRDKRVILSLSKTHILKSVFLHLQTTDNMEFQRFEVTLRPRGLRESAIRRAMETSLTLLA